MKNRIKEEMSVKFIRRGDKVRIDETNKVGGREGNEHRGGENWKNELRQK